MFWRGRPGLLRRSIDISPIVFRLMLPALRFNFAVAQMVSVLSKMRQRDLPGQDSPATVQKDGVKVSLTWENAATRGGQALAVLATEGQA
ncbi:MAG: hypothetical protein KAH44_27775 [Oricola sp.]|nr:hypothetical protein [Oricola sp.]